MLEPITLANNSEIFCYFLHSAGLRVDAGGTTDPGSASQVVVENDFETNKKAEKEIEIEIESLASRQ